MDANKRLLLAIVLSFLVLVGYGYLFPAQNNKISDTNKTTQAPTTHKATTSAPTVAAPAPTKEKATQAAPVSVDNSIAIATVKTAKYTLKFDNLGRIKSAILKEKKYKTKDGKPLDLITTNTIKPLEIRFKDEAINELAFKNSYSASSNMVDATSNSATLTLTQDLNGVKVTKTLTFYPEGNYNLKVEVSNNKEYFITPGLRPMADKSMYMVVRGVLIRENSGIINTFEKGDAKEIKSFDKVDVAASIDRYYTTLLYSKNSTFNATVAASGAKGNEEEPVIFIGAKDNLELQGYIGPKEWKLFSKLDKKLEDVIEFGWFTFLAKPFFKVMLAIFNFVGNWGWTIVLFTILVKLVLFPLSYKGLMSMQKLKDLAPKMKELREKYGKDPAKMNQQMMELYKKHGANPMGGCLPMLLQIPIFFALYRVLLNADELQGAPWIGWIQDLSVQDPLYVLPVLMGITMYIQQKITPNTMTDPTQQKIFQWLPAIMTLFFLTFPAGLVLYWLVNNILTIAQQAYVNKAYESYKAKQKEIKNKK
jgi:YidC/Oxa1 family membrane protein insertase